MNEGRPSIEYSSMCDEIARLRNANKILAGTLRLIASGLKSGKIKSHPIMDRTDPNAEEWPVRSLGEIVDSALLKAEGDSP